MNNHTAERLKELQALPLERKVGFSIARIVEFHNMTGGKCYVSYSGGKDSTVLLHLCRELYPDIPAVFCNTGLEYPEVVEFVKQQNNITIIRPDKTFKEVLEQQGYPVISKEVSQTVYKARMGQKDAIAKLDGTRIDKKTGKISQYNIPKYKYLLNAPFKISHRCCDELKKKPFHKYEKETGNSPIIGTMAQEGALRRINWIRYGCNSFDGDRKSSAPLSFWTERDILRFLLWKNIPIPSVYGTIEWSRESIWLTGVKRTGCIFCPIGLHHDGPTDRFHKLEQSHPALYKYCMNSIGLKPVIEYLRGKKI